VYAIAGIPLGRLSDKLRRTRVLSVGVLIWSLLTAAGGAASNFVTMFLLRLGVGIGEAACAPAANSMIGDLYPSEKRARALGLFMLGLPLGTLAAFAIGGWLAQNYGWRYAFYVAAVPGLLVAAALLFLPEPVRGAQETYDIDAGQPVENPFRKVMAIRTLWWVTLSGATLNIASYALNTFLPALMIRYHHASVAEAGVVGAVVFGVTGLVGLTVGGQIADRIHLAFPSGRLKFGAICLLCAAPLLWFGLARPPGEIIQVTVLLSLGWMLWFMYFVTVYPTVQDVVEPRLRATAMALFFFFQYVLGAGFGTLITGMLSDGFAAQAMRAAGAAELTDAMRALGLQASLNLVVPLTVLVTGVALLLASRHFVADAANASGKQGLSGAAKAPAPKIAARP
jgi:predicted MFS family arabinose efflux permease